MVVGVPGSPFKPNELNFMLIAQKLSKHKMKFQQSPYYLMKVLLFSPNAFITPHALPEALVAQSLIKNGIEVVKIGCAGLYQDYCVSMSAASVWPTDSNEIKKQICLKCKKNNKEINDLFSFNYDSIDSYLTPADLGLIDELGGSIKADNWIDFTYDSIPVGKYAAYEFLLNYKLNTTNLTTSEFDIYKIQIRNSLKTLIAGERLFDVIKPDRFLVYHALYSVNHIMSAIAQKRGIPFYSMHAGSHLLHRLSEMTIFRGVQAQYLTNRSTAWFEYKKRPLSSRIVKKVSEHIGELFNATSPWVYSVKSTGKNTAQLKEYFSIDAEQKVVLATMSSADETFAGSIADALPPQQESMFPTQLTWIESLIEWAKQYPKIILIIRVHPREFPNKREGVLSVQAKALRILFHQLPSNVKINWPDDDISLHDLLKIVDVGLNATSTVGLEMLLFGIPVIIYDPNQFIAYPRELNCCPQNQNEYFLAIQEAIDSGLSLDHVYGVYQWLAFRSEVVGIDIGDGFQVAQVGRLVKMTQKILKRLGLTSTEPASLPGLKGSGNISLKNEKWLCHAITNGQESHLMDFVRTLPPYVDADLLQTKKQIQKSLRRLLLPLSRVDQPFLFRVNRLFGGTK